MIIFDALGFLKQLLNNYLKFKLGDEYSDAAVLSNPVKHDGTLATNTADKILLTLVNIEEERVGKVQTPQRKTINGREVAVAPEIHLNLYLLIIANRNNYEESLKFISHVITFFQSQNVFVPQNAPGMPSSLQKLILELATASFEQLNNLWGAMGAKYLPSVLYKVRMLTVQADRAQQAPEYISGIESEVEG